MTGAQLDKILTDKEIDRPELYAHLQMSRQLFGHVLKRKSIDSGLLKRIADFTKIPLSEMLAEPPKDKPVLNSNTVNEAPTQYGKTSISNAELIIETKKIYEENVELHKTIAARGEFILKLLNS